MDIVLSNKSLVKSRCNTYASEAPSHCYKTNTTDCHYVGVAQRTRNGVKFLARRPAFGREEYLGVIINILEELFEAMVVRIFVQIRAGKGILKVSPPICLFGVFF